MITDRDVTDVAVTLTAGGDDWEFLAQVHPLVKRHHPGVPAGPGTIRPWVQLDGVHEHLDIPMRLYRWADGTWGLPGSRQGWPLGEQV